jgi:hypothetical protein
MYYRSLRLQLGLHSRRVLESDSDLFLNGLTTMPAGNRKYEALSKPRFTQVLRNILSD